MAAKQLLKKLEGLVTKDPNESLILLKNELNAVLEPERLNTLYFLRDELVFSKHRDTFFLFGTTRHVVSEINKYDSKHRKDIKSKSRGRPKKYDDEFGLKIMNRLDSTKFQKYSKSGNEQDKISFIRLLYKMSYRKAPSESRLREIIGEK